MPDLSLIPLEDLLTEICTRCSPACFIGTKYEGQSKFMSFTKWKGNNLTCYGMCHELAVEIQGSIIKEMNDG